MVLVRAAHGKLAQRLPMMTPSFWRADKAGYWMMIIENYWWLVNVMQFLKRSVWLELLRGLYAYYGHESKYSILALWTFWIQIELNMHLSFVPFVHPFLWRPNFFQATTSPDGRQGKDQSGPRQVPHLAQPWRPRQHVPWPLEGRVLGPWWCLGVFRPEWYWGSPFFNL